jgi:hypothetical protein
VIESIFFILLLLALYQPNPRTQAAATGFVVAAIVHDQLTIDSSVAIYHISAATVDISVLFFISLMPRADSITRFLARSCIISAVLNSFGYMWGNNSWLPGVYSVIFMVFYAVLGAFLMKGVVSGGGKYSYLPMVYRSNRKGCAHTLSMAYQGRG